jgi:trk system potassium uptake protein TrkH
MPFHDSHYLPFEGGPARRLSPVQLFVLSFTTLIAVGTAGFLFLPGLYTGARLGFVDALFTATSAVCVTGLIVVDTATYFTPLGQAWVAALIQAGGIGILTLTTLIMYALGRPSLNLEEASGGGTGIPVRFVDERALLRTVVGVTFTLEALGAFFLWLDWRNRFGSAGAVWPAVFHAVSAFCNAGFSIFSDSLVSLRTSPWTLTVIAGLIVAGGLGFLVMEELRMRARRAVPRLSVHTRLALTATGILILVGWGAFLVFEWGHELAGMSVVDRIANAMFMSVTPRTAGFNSVDYSQVSNPSLFLTILLMIIGGSPGSTAGGFKTTTFALLFLTFLSRVRGDTEVHAFGRTIPRETLDRAASLVVGGVILLGVAIFLLMMTEAHVGGFRDREHVIQLAFEAHSAFGTVGLSMGVTSVVTSAGRLVLVGLMFIGRVGPAAMVAAMATGRLRPKSPFRYGREDVLIG